MNLKEKIKQKDSWKRSYFNFKCSSSYLFFMIIHIGRSINVTDLMIHSDCPFDRQDVLTLLTVCGHFEGLEFYYTECLRDGDVLTAPCHIHITK